MSDPWLDPDSGKKVIKDIIRLIGAYEYDQVLDNLPVSIYSFVSVKMVL